jgi:hypothetical protein
LIPETMCLEEGSILRGIVSAFSHWDDSSTAGQLYLRLLEQGIGKKMVLQRGKQVHMIRHQ